MTFDMKPSLQERDAVALWHPFSPRKGLGPPLPAVRAEGNYIYLEDGRAILDAIGSWWVNIHGHNHPYITKKINEQLHAMHHIIFAGFTHEPAVTLAERLLDKCKMPNGKVFLSDNGSTSIEVALKICVQFWKNQGHNRTTFVALEGAYHGDTFGAMAVGERGIFNAPFEDQLFNVAFINPPVSKDVDGDLALAQLENILKSDPPIAFIVEPLIQGSTGMRIYSPAWLDQAIGLCNQHCVPVIADEIFTGFYRTGTFMASDQLRNRPDMICLSKGLTAGSLPLGATLLPDWLVKAFDVEELHKSFLHGHSFTGNPLACAAANASLDLLEAKEFPNQLAFIIDQQERLASDFARDPIIKNARALGTVLRMEFATEEQTGYENEARNMLYDKFLRGDVLVRPLGNVVYTAVPYSFGKKEFDQLERALKSVLGRAFF